MPKASGGVDNETEYEKIRRENMLSNQKLLQDLMLQKMDCPAGLAAGFAVLGIDEPKPKPNRRQRKRPTQDAERDGKGTRRSARNAGKPVVSYAKDGEGIVDRSKMPKMVSRPDKQWNEDDSDQGEDEEGKVRVNKLVGRVHDPKTFGLIPGVSIGSWWETRAECSAAAIHAPFVAGISGGPEGAYSVALSGGYDDDIDMGDAFTYTGSGGRDLKGTAKNPKNLRTAPQSSHQSFEHSFNKALKVSSETRKPVRVIRVQAPERLRPRIWIPIRCLYIVERAWMDRGNNPKGWKVCKFAFRRIPGQPPVPVQGKTPKASSASEDLDMNEETDGQKSEEETEAQGETEADDDKEEDEKKPKNAKAKVEEEPESEEKEAEEEETEEEKPAPKKRGRQSKVEATESVVEDKPKRGRKPEPKPKRGEEPEPEEDQPAIRRSARAKSKAKSEGEDENENEEEEEESVPPAKKSKVEEDPKKRGSGRPTRNKK
ncbi:SAD/SRA domain [Rhizoctonia solani]|uniref:SAD/SRA domain n=1 Tax=Rhizoctonia solani TaxID=456999 RepID=A0A8H7I2M9_9AGAM|nr:SAD/SRA domain [Rhizoctonia solani]